MSVPKCTECVYLVARMTARANRANFYCEHPDKDYIRDFCKEHKIEKMPGFVCFGGGRDGIDATIKTSPTFCPKRRKEAEK